MKTEIELESGEMVEMEFVWQANDWGEYDYMLNYYTPYDENTGAPLLPVNAMNMELTDQIYKQLERAVMEELEEMGFDAADI